MSTKQELQTRLDKIEKIMQSDGWQNLMTYSGLIAKDKMVNTTYVLNSSEILTESNLSDIYRGDGIGKKIVDIPAQDMVREWFRIDGDSDDAANKYLNKRRAKKAVKLALTWARLFGGGLIVMGIDDGARGRAPMEAPLNEGKIKTIGFFRIYDRHSVTWDSQDLDNDAGSENYGKPRIYTISPRSSNMRPYKVHYTRCLRFNGIDIPDRVASTNNGWGDSILQSVFTRLRGFADSLIATEAIIQEFTVGILTINNLQDLIAGGQEALIQRRLQQIDQSKHILNTMLVDKEEEFTRISATVNGIKDILEFLKDVISSVSGIPQIKLFGEQTKGIGSQATGNIRLYYDDIAEYQNNDLRPNLERLVDLVYLAGDFTGGANEDRDLKFNKLWQMSDKEIAESRHLMSKSDESYIKNGVLSPDEVRKSRFGGETYSSEIVLEGDKAPGLPEKQVAKKSDESS